MSSRFERTGGETRYEGKLFSVHEETFRHEDGDEATREIVRHQGAVGIVCHDGERVWLVRQPREAVGKAAEHWELLHSFYTSPGFTDEECHVYLATGLSDASAAVEDSERIDVETRPLAELDALIDEVRDSKTLIGLLELRRRRASGH